MFTSKLLIVNYVDDFLFRELLRRGYKISAVRAKGRYLALPKERFNLIYFAKYISPLALDDIMCFLPPKVPTIYGFYNPSVIFKPYRPQNYLYNLVSVTKLILLRVWRVVTAVHNIDEHDLLTSLGFKCYYVPYGVDTNTFMPNPKREDFTAVFVGARYEKGADMLVHIIPKVLRKAPNIKFVLTGFGFLGHIYHSLKDKFKNNVVVCEGLPQHEFIQLFRQCHVLLFPSRYEAFGRVALEALSSGMPVVCYGIAGVPRDIIKKHGVGVVASPFKINGIVNGILHYYDLWKKSEFEHVSNLCRSVALKYDWRIVADRWDNMFRQVIQCTN